MGISNGKRKCAPVCVLSLLVCTLFSENKKGVVQNWQEIVGYALKIWGIPKIAAFPHPEIVSMK